MSIYQFLFYLEALIRHIFYKKKVNKIRYLQEQLKKT